MPIHFNDLDVTSEARGLGSALIVPCNLCPAVTVAVRQGKPFMRFWRHLARSVPFEQHIAALQSRLRQIGVKTKVFRSSLYHHWFLCMWSSRRRKKLCRDARRYDAVIVLGCDSAAETVRDAVKATGCKVIEGMQVAGIMNAQMRFHLPCNISFDECKIVSISRQEGG